MIDEIRKTTVNKFKKLCQKLKINNWQKEVFMANAIEIMSKQQESIEKFEKQIADLKVDLEAASHTKRK